MVLREAGVERVAVLGSRELAFFGPPPQTLDDLAPLFTGMDLVLCEGFKRADLPKVEVHRERRRFRCRTDASVVAVVSRTRPPVQVGWFRPENLKGLADWLVRSYARRPKRAGRPVQTPVRSKKHN